MHRSAEQGPSIQPLSPFAALRVAVLVAIGLGAYGPLGAATAERYAPLPWGIDSPAGRCVVCHSLEPNGPFRVAPNLWGIIDAPKARDSRWYAYSPALEKKGGVWTADELDAFLDDANRYLPGTRKSIRVQDPAERREIIDFLKQLKD